MGIEARALAAALVLAAARAQAAPAPDPLQVDLPALVGRADLDYDRPASRSEEGMPIGNGRTGSLVWTTPAALHLQVNRVDVFALDDTSTSFPRADTDYASGCGYVDIHLVDYGDDVFPDGAAAGELAGDTLTSPTRRGETVRLAPKGAAAATVRVPIAPRRS